MAQLIPDQRDVQFVLYGQMKTEELTEKEKFGDFNHETFDMVLFEARKLAEKEILPTAPNG